MHKKVVSGRFNLCLLHPFCAASQQLMKVGTEKGEKEMGWVSKACNPKQNLPEGVTGSWFTKKGALEKEGHRMV